MALDKPTLKASIKTLFENEATQTTDPAASRERIAQGLADAIEVYVKSGDGIYQTGTLIADGTFPVTATTVGAVVKIQ